MAAPRLDQELLQSLNGAWSGMERTMAWQQDMIKKLMDRSSSLDALHKAVDATDRINKLHTELDRVNKDRQALRIENRQLEKRLADAMHSRDWDELCELVEAAQEGVVGVTKAAAQSSSSSVPAKALGELITRMGAVTAKLREIVDESGGAGADAGSGSEHA
jgi:regulator of replication initiation timing